MSFVTGFKLQREEYPSQAEWIEKLLRPLNSFSQSTMNAVNGGLIVGQNVMATYKTSRVTIPALPWITISPQSSWTNVAADPVGYYVDADGCVNFKGSMTAGTKTDATTIFTMPASLYPAADARFGIPHDDKNSAQGLLSKTDGTMKIFNVTGSAATLFFTSIYYFAAIPPAPPAFIGPDWPLKLATDMPLPVQACFVGRVVDTETDEVKSVAVSGCHWEATQRGEIQIKRVDGLTPERTYDITFLLIGG